MSLQASILICAFSWAKCYEWHFKNKTTYFLFVIIGSAFSECAKTLRDPSFQMENTKAVTPTHKAPGDGDVELHSRGFLYSKTDSCGEAD